MNQEVILHRQLKLVERFQEGNAPLPPQNKIQNQTAKAVQERVNPSLKNF